MKVIVPLVITDAMLSYASIPEDDHPEWASGETYAIGDFVISTITHKVYRALSENGGAVNPDLEWAAIDDSFDLANTNPVDWDRIGATNRWRAFDQSPTRIATQSGTMRYTIALPRYIGGVAFFNLKAEQAVVRLRSGGDLLYELSKSLFDNSNVYDWWTYFFAPVEQITETTFTDLPDYTVGNLEIELVQGTGESQIGEIALGPLIDLGETEASPRIQGRDFSTIEPDAFGQLTTVVRQAVRRIHYVALADRQFTLFIDNVLRGLRGGTPAVWIGDDREFLAVLNYGYLFKYTIDPSFRASSISKLTLETEGIV